MHTGAQKKYVSQKLTGARRAGRERCIFPLPDGTVPQREPNFV